ncbi:MAG: alpha/beta hydrolase [Symplocastrum torsivum CPER-KK1]|uniref:Alpha/beta hydrolase n=1 Tax=Symplocastrum torsivum CPER-KK1 TaxID=450513 RepID=A0A951PR94_9CYAN|nr:alpha/beta hydrolase [Symplocastrum torsivum CPER-KK1]
MKSFLLRSLLTLFGASAYIMQPLVVDVAESASLTTSDCSEVQLPVALAPDEPKQYQVYGQLCGQSPLGERTVQVLVSGTTYSHIYWDVPYQPENYSYVDALTEAGYATFNIDRIGIGRSSHPPADQVTVASNTYVLEQVVQGLRLGQIGGIPQTRIMLVGFSSGAFGSVVGVASQDDDLAGVILSGFLHNQNPDWLEAFINSFYPAQLDPRLGEQNLPNGYLTTQPGTRGELFYEPNADPQVIAFDEATKETVTTGEAATNAAAIFAETSKLIRVPVFLAVGQYDGSFCTGNICESAENVAALEAPFFSPEANLQTFVLPGAGHSLNLHPNAPEWFEAARQWSDQYVGTTTTSESVPEPSGEFGLLTLTALGAVLRWKGRFK